LRASALTRGAWLAVWQNDFADAFPASVEALSIWQELDNQAALPDTFLILGIAAYGRGDVERARSSWWDCARLARLVGDGLSLALALNNLGALAREEGRPDDALELFQQSMVVSEEHRFMTSMALVLSNLGGLAVERGEIAHGEHQVQQSLRLYDSLREAWGVASCLTSLASIALLSGESGRATRLAAAAAGLQQRLDLVARPGFPGDLDQEIAALRETLGEEFQAHWDQGAAMTVAEAVAEALRNADDDAELPSNSEKGESAPRPSQT
jgi:tetratricopeptide (TPR) repeat protein